MHAALIRTRAMNALIALLAAVALVASVTPILADGDSRPEPSITPGSYCPPVC